jgi:hypothetical protein
LVTSAVVLQVILRFDTKALHGALDAAGLERGLRLTRRLNRPAADFMHGYDW